VHDPFADLRASLTPVPPDPDFAAALRSRLERALSLPREVVVSMPAVEEVTVPPQGAAVPYLAVADAQRAIAWYVDVFGARLVGEPIVMPDGRVGHAELALAGGVLYLADEFPDIGVTAPRTGEAAVSLMLAVDDADAVRERAMAAGASGDRPPYDAYGTRNAWIVDPFGHRWGLNSPITAVAPSYREGDVGYVSLWVPDTDRAADFYTDVLGWSVAREHRNQVQGTTPAVGMASRRDEPNLFCCFAVDDVRAAAERVRAAGGVAGELSPESYGVVVECTDDQGTPFALYQEPADHVGVRPPPNGRRPGDLGYLTLEVVDSARARAFYGSVLGWQVAAGRVEDGWQVADTVPMIGLSGGHERARAIPMWLVDDVVAAVRAVRSAGGVATEPQTQPYGITSECTDDQGLRFYLGQL
jgi:predicted enzyme related to lactoylglutathione lyase